MIHRMKEDGYGPATLDDALAMGVKFRGLQQTIGAILFIGTKWLDSDDGKYKVPCLKGGCIPERRLCLFEFKGTWWHFCFAAVRKQWVIPLL